MNMVVEAMQVLRCSQQTLFVRSYGWYYGASPNCKSVADQYYTQYVRTKQYPHFVLAFSEAVRRAGGIAAR
jgi:hypothetical protein